MSAPEKRLELLVQEDGEGLALLSPSVGWFTCAVPEGGVLVGGATAGVLRALEVSQALVVPAGVRGRVVSARPERVSEPVAHRSVLYRLAPLGGAEEGEGSDGGRAGTVEQEALVFRAPYSGRFWHRPSPKDPPLVRAGSALLPGTVVGLVEVMKTFTHLHYEAGAGLPERARVVRLLVDDGAEVAGGQALIELEDADA